MSGGGFYRDAYEREHMKRIREIQRRGPIEATSQNGPMKRVFSANSAPLNALHGTSIENSGDSPIRMGDRVLGPNTAAWPCRWCDTWNAIGLGSCEGCGMVRL